MRIFRRLYLALATRTNRRGGPQQRTASAPLSGLVLSVGSPPLPESFTERRWHPTPTAQTLSNQGSVGRGGHETSRTTEGSQRVKTVLGISLGRRYAGAALVVRGTPVYLRSRRGLGYRGAKEADAFLAWLADLERECLVDLVAIDGLTAPEPILALVIGRRVPALVVERRDLVNALRMPGSTTAAVCRELTRRFPHLAALGLHPTSSLSRASEKGRYWEHAIVAAGVAIAASYQLDIAYESTPRTT